MRGENSYTGLGEQLGRHTPMRMHVLGEFTKSRKIMGGSYLNLPMYASEYRGDAISSLPSTLRNITNGSHDSAWICHAQHVPCQMRLFESSISPTAAA